MAVFVRFPDPDVGRDLAAAAKYDHASASLPALIEEAGSQPATIVAASASQKSEGP